MTTLPGPGSDDRTVSGDRCPLVTRRQVLAGLGAAATVVVAGRYGLSIWGGRDSVAAATTTTLAPPTTPDGAPRTLLVIEMGGGNDGLNMIVPHASGAYYDLRRDLAIDDPLDLDGEVGLHPAMEFLSGQYAAGQVAVVEGLGYPDPDLSHFASMSNWWTGTLDGSSQAGWLGRYLDVTVGPEDPLAAVTIGPGPSPAMRGEKSFVVSIRDMSGLAPQLPPWIDTRNELMALWEGFVPSPIDSPGLYGQVQQAIGGTVGAVGRLEEALTGEPSRGRPSLATDLEVAAALIVSDVAPRVIYVHGFGDFDTHDGQAQRHDRLMAELDQALADFFSTLEAAGASERALVVTASEFGRRAASNGSGTDHGTAAGHLVIGREVAGGRYGQAPDLTRLDSRGNLVHTVDYRSLYATILDDWLGMPHHEVLGSQFETLPVLTALDR